jgi:anti-sigma factor RsiW
MSAERDELRRIIEELPDERVPAVLAEAQRQGRRRPAAEWPPAWFGSFASGRRDLGSNHEDLLADGFGRS